MHNAIKIKSVVVVGNQLGRTVGMPTANFDTTNIKDKLPDKDGVYISKVTLPDKSVKVGLTNVGTKPSIDDSGDKNIETHILDFDGDLYGQEICVELVKYIREIKKFANLEEVKSQVDRDIDFAKSFM